jgi:hypothetical protein
MNIQYLIRFYDSISLILESLKGKKGHIKLLQEIPTQNLPFGGTKSGFGW